MWQAQVIQFPGIGQGPMKLQRKPIADACRWSEALEIVTLSNLRLVFVWQRIVLRSVWGL